MKELGDELDLEVLSGNAVKATMATSQEAHGRASCVTTLQGRANAVLSKA